MDTFMSQSFECHVQASKYFDKWARTQPTIMAQSQKYGLWVTSSVDYQDLRDNHGFVWSKWKVSE
mgnify:CR=1 FL=1